MEFHVVTASVDLFIWDSNSLKDKRAVLRSMLDRAKARFNVSIAEVGGQDSWDRSRIAIACVSGELYHASQVVQGVIDFIEANYPCDVVRQDLESY